MTKGSAVRFNDIKLQIGINDLSSFRNDGRFICEKSGLYIISTSIMSTTSDAEFSIFVNNDEVAHEDTWETGGILVQQ